MQLFGPPDIDRLKANGDIRGLIRSLRYPKSYQEAQQALVEIGAPAVRLLIAALKNKDISWAAVDALKRIGAQAAPLLVEALDDKKVSGYAAMILEEIGPPAIESLIAALASDDPRAVYLTVRALGEIGDKRAVKPILSVLNDASHNDKFKQVQPVAIQALEKLGHPIDTRVSLEAFLEALEQRGFEVSPRSSRRYYRSHAPRARYIISKRVVRLERENLANQGPKWQLVRSFSIANELYLALIAADILPSQ